MSRTSNFVDKSLRYTVCNFKEIIFIIATFAATGLVLLNTENKERKFVFFILYRFDEVSRNIEQKHRLSIHVGIFCVY